MCTLLRRTEQAADVDIKRSNIGWGRIGLHLQRTNSLPTSRKLMSIYCASTEPRSQIVIVNFGTVVNRFVAPERYDKASGFRVWVLQYSLLNTCLASQKASTRSKWFTSQDNIRHPGQEQILRARAARECIDAHSIRVQCMSSRSLL